MKKPGLAKGTRDLGPEETTRRKYLLGTLERVFINHGFEGIETPALENIETLTGKYGEEGDQLLFRILDSGDYLSNLRKSELGEQKISQIDSGWLQGHISSRGLRYDLTVPFARYVSMNRHRISMPFRRYQMQPVWRADRPQKGRYREFWQCDADIIGNRSLSNEADLISVFHDAFAALGISSYQIHINHRKLLEAVATHIGIADRFTSFTVALDKYDKIGESGVEAELSKLGVDSDSFAKLKPFLRCAPLNAESLSSYALLLGDQPSGVQALSELQELVTYLESTNSADSVLLDGTLARGLSYYTGCIFEVKIAGSGMGSIAAGGRYDDLTGIFGVRDMSGVGISFGADRIYDYMEQQNLFPGSLTQCRVVVCSMSEAALIRGRQYASILRSRGVSTLTYPSPGKIGKQLDYVRQRGIPYALILGEDEVANNTATLKNMETGAQQNLSIEHILEQLKP